jgi:hypothetical protein
MRTTTCFVRDREIICDDEQWDEIDARGIYLTFVCERCRDEKLSKYRADVLTDCNYWHIEPIDEP